MSEALKRVLPTSFPLPDFSPITADELLGEEVIERRARWFGRSPKERHGVIVDVVEPSVVIEFADGTRETWPLARVLAGRWED